VARDTGIDDKLEATFDVESRVYSPREQAALELATLFTEDYHAITDAHVARWQEHFTAVELIELGTFMALADGFGKLVELLGLGDVLPVDAAEI
jgi:alkylhydroperoxidase family enzyme